MNHKKSLPLGRLFQILFFLTILIPCIALLVSAREAWTSATELTRNMVVESQGRFVGELDGFLTDSYIPEMMKIAQSRTRYMGSIWPESLPELPDTEPSIRQKTHYCQLKRDMELHWLLPLGYDTKNMSCDDFRSLLESPLRLHLMDYHYGIQPMDYFSVISAIMEPRDTEIYGDANLADSREKRLWHKMATFRDIFQHRQRLYEKLGFLSRMKSYLIRTQSEVDQAISTEIIPEDVQILFKKISLPAPDSLKLLARISKIPEVELKSAIELLFLGSAEPDPYKLREAVRTVENLRIFLHKEGYRIRDNAVAESNEPIPPPVYFRQLNQAVFELTGSADVFLSEIIKKESLSRREWEKLPRAYLLYKHSHEDWMQDWHDFGAEAKIVHFPHQEILPIHRLGHIQSVADHLKLADRAHYESPMDLSIISGIKRASTKIAQNDPLLNALNVILKFLTTGSVGRELFVDASRLMLIKQVIGSDLYELINSKPVLMRSGAYQTLFAAAFFPPDFNESQYLRNLAMPPVAMVITLVDRMMLGRQFASMINIESSADTSYFEMIAKFNQEAKTAIPMYAGEEVISEIRELQKALLVKKHGSSLEESSALMSLVYQFSEFFGAFPDTKAINKSRQEAYWRKNTRIRLLPESVANQWLEEQGVEDSRLVDKDNKVWLVSVLPSHAPMIPGFVYVTLLAESVAYRDLLLFLIVSICLALLGALSALFLGQSMSKNMVHPLMNLQKKVFAFTHGENLDYGKIGSQGDEIQIMENDFLDMAITINQRLAQTSFLNEMNRRTTDGESSASVLEDLLLRMVAICKAKHASVRFMERNNPAVTIAQLHTPDFVSEGEYQRISLENPFSSEEAKLDSDLIGLVDLYPKSAWPPVESEIDFFQSLASLALAIQGKAWLDKLKKDNVEGQEIQLSLMPSGTLDTNGNLDLASSYVAARFLGGDFFDWFLCPDGAVLIISDVSGKGVGAALFGAACKATLRQLMADSLECGSNLARLNELLCIDKQNSLFASLFLARIDYKNHLLHYASAGHNKMILLRKGNTIEFLNAKGLPLGMFTPALYETKTIPFNPGDIICLYTDGVNELEDPMLNLYGIPRLESLLLSNSHLSMTDLKNHLLQDLENYREMRPPSDDITFILAKSVVPG